VRARVERRLGTDPRAAHEAELEELSQQVARYVDAIAAAGDVPEIGARLRSLAERRQRLQEMISALPATSPLPRIDWSDLERQARRKMDDWRGMLGRKASVARPVLRELLEAPIRFTPIIEGTRRGYQFEGAVRFGELLAGNVVSDVVASPGGLEPPAYRLGGGRSIH
jgi:hypothetical protein